MASRLTHRALLLALFGASALSAPPARAAECHDSTGAAVPPPCPPSSEADHGAARATPFLGAVSPVEEAHFFGVRGSETWSGDRVGTRRSLSATAVVRHFDYDARRLFSGRSVGSAFIGGGSAGFEGGIGGALGAGIRAPFGQQQGIVARLGLEGYVLGNDRFYASMLELPQGQVGYQILTQAFLFELTGTMGPVLTGRYRAATEPTRRLTGMFETGLRLGAGFRNAHLELGYSRYERWDDAPGPALDRVAGSLCGLASGVGLCADMELYDRGSQRMAVGPGDTVYLGFHVGVLTGQRTHAADPPPRAPRPAKSRHTASSSPSGSTAAP